MARLNAFEGDSTNNQRLFEKPDAIIRLCLRARRGKSVDNPPAKSFARRPARKAFCGWNRVGVVKNAGGSRPISQETPGRPVLLAKRRFATAAWERS